MSPALRPAAAAAATAGTQPLWDFDHGVGGRSGFLMAATAQESGRAAPIAPFLVKFMGFMTFLFVAFHLIHVHHHSEAVTSHARSHRNFKSKIQQASGIFPQDPMSQTDGDAALHPFMGSVEEFQDPIAERGNKLTNMHSTSDSQFDMHMEPVNPYQAGESSGGGAMPGAPEAPSNAESQESQGLSGPQSGKFTANFVMTSGAKPAGMSLKFPMKKLLNKLTHYSIGKVSQDLLTLLPSSDFLRERGRTGSCAVVGNGGSMLLYELGQDIDSHDMVIRLNSGPVAGFENIVGSRTDVRLVNRLHMGFRETDQEAVLQHVSTQDSLKQFISFRKKNREVPTHLISLDFIEHVYQYVEKGVPSNGFYATLLASEMCETVTLYGFLREWRGSTRYHYYNMEEPDSTQTKRDDREEHRMKLFMEERSLTHRYGEPCMTESATCGNSDQETKPCRGCPHGTTCSCKTWYPVPLPGFCYGREHPRGTGVPDVGCIRACRDSLECPGGVSGGICPPEVLEDIDAGLQDRTLQSCANLQ